MNTPNKSSLASKEKTYLITIVILSVAIPAAVALLLFLPQTGKLGSVNVSILPKLNAVLNTATAISLLIGYYFIKNNNIQYHRRAMLSAFLFSSIFLISYVVYHYQAPHTVFGGTGNIKYLYYTLLITHIILAVVIVPLVLLSIYYGISDQLVKHKKLARWTLPIWLYVAVSGVLVFLLISPYYA